MTLAQGLAVQRQRLAKATHALRSPLYRRALRQGVLATVEHQPVLQSLPAPAAVIDVGANVGQFALVARHVFPDAHIVSFEPVPSAARKLRAVFADDRHLRCIETALSSEAGTAAFYVTSGADDSSSLLPVTARQVVEYPDTKDADAVSVTTARLDDLLDSLDLPPGPVLLKIDTQGSELAVLQGAERALERVAHLIVEASFLELYQGQASAADLLDHLVARGWRLRAVYDVKTSRLTGEPFQADFLFERPAGQ